jgi:hypothetical protein
MEARSQEERDQRELLLRLLPMSASLAGLCIAAITLFRSNERLVRMESLADDMLAICAFLFLCATYMTFWALRTRKPVMVLRLSKAVDGTFLAALTMLVGVGFLMVYTLL